MKVTKRQLRQIIKEEKAKLQEQATGVSPRLQRGLNDLESMFEREINARMSSEDRRWFQNEDVILAIAEMLDNLKDTMVEYGEM